jgi:hypothetical protein
VPWYKQKLTEEPGIPSQEECYTKNAKKCLSILLRSLHVMDGEHIIIKIFEFPNTLNINTKSAGFSKMVIVAWLKRAYLDPLGRGSRSRSGAMKMFWNNEKPEETEF